MLTRDPVISFTLATYKGEPIVRRVINYTMGIFKSKEESEPVPIQETEEERQERYKEYGCVIQDSKGNKIEFKPVESIDLNSIYEEAMYIYGDREVTYDPVNYTRQQNFTKSKVKKKKNKKQNFKKRFKNYSLKNFKTKK